MYVGRGLGVGMGVVLALTALCPMSYADEAEATGHGAWLGISAERLSDEWRERAGYWADGVMVVRVAPRSPADQVGIGLGDVLVRVGERTLRNPDDLAEAQSTMEPGHPVSVVVARDGGRMIKIFKVEPDRVPGPTAEETAPGSEPKSSSPGVQVEGAPSVPNPVPGVEAAPPAKAGTQEAVVPVEPDAKADAGAKPGSSVTVNQHADSRGLGLKCEDLNPDLAAALGEPDGKGVLVIQVQSGSIADRSGIRPGDIITKVGDQSVGNLGRLDPALAATASPISFITLRQGVTREVVADLEVPSSPEGASERHTDAWRDQVLIELRDEVRKLRDEVHKLRREMEEPKRY